MNKRTVKFVLLVSVVVAALLVSVVAQERPQKESSYAPVDIKESFASIWRG